MSNRRPIDAIGDITGDTDAEAWGARQTDEEPSAARDLSDDGAAALVQPEPISPQHPSIPLCKSGPPMTPPPGWKPPDEDDVRPVGQNLVLRLSFFRDRDAAHRGKGTGQGGSSE